MYSFSNSKTKHQELTFLPRILIDESAYNLVNEQNKKYCFPFEIVLNKSKKATSTKIIYRHFFNSSHYRIDDLNESFYLDNFNLENFNTENIHKQRFNFEKHFTREEDKSLFENLLISDETYIKIISEFNPSIHTALKLVYDFYMQKNFKRCFGIIKDLKDILKSSQVVPDSHLIIQIEKLEKILNKNEGTDSKEDSFTIKIES